MHESVDNRDPNMVPCMSSMTEDDAKSVMPGAVTDLLIKWGDGDESALPLLIDTVYDRLSAIAANQLAREYHKTIEPRELVHETYCKLVLESGMNAKNRAHFFSIAAKVMRRILVDRARKRSAIKRGADAPHLPLEPELLSSDEGDVDILALDLALHKLKTQNERQARIIELRFFGGLEVEECATALGVSERTVKRDWQSAREALRKLLN